MQAAQPDHFPLVALLIAIESNARNAREAMAGAYVLSQHRPTGLVPSTGLRIQEQADPRQVWAQKLQSAQAAASMSIGNLRMVCADLEKHLTGQPGSADTEE